MKIESVIIYRETVNNKIMFTNDGLIFKKKGKKKKPPPPPHPQKNIIYKQSKNWGFGLVCRRFYSYNVIIYIDLLDSKYRCVLHVPWQNLLYVDFVLLTLSCTQFSNGYYVSDLLQVSGFLRVLRFPPTIKLTATI
jgi:hypothetical protein